MISKGWIGLNDIYLLEKNENETEIKFEHKETSSKEFYVLLRNYFFLSDSNEEKTLVSSTFKPRKHEFSPIEKYLIEYKAKIEQEKIEQLIDKLVWELVVELKYFSLDDSGISSAERKILDIEEKYSFRILGEVLQTIYVKYNDFPNILAGICKGLERFDLDEVLPWGPTMLSGLLVHKSEVVKEYAVSLVENWSDVTLLPILRNLKCPSLWLQEYISDVVKYLEECDVLHKEAI